MFVLLCRCRAITLYGVIFESSSSKMECEFAFFWHNMLHQLRAVTG
jgi:hypothetical protein